MAKLLKLRRGTTTQHGSFTGAEGEVTVDTDKETLVVHDGSTAGGHPVAAEDMANVSAANIKGRLGTTLTNAEINGSAAIAGTKISPDFGSQGITTTGGLNSGNYTITSATPTITFTDNDNNPDYKIITNGGAFLIHDSTNGTDKIKILNGAEIDITPNVDFANGIDVTGHATVSQSLTVTGTTALGETLTITGNDPNITFVDSNNNPDYKIFANAGTFNIIDSTNNQSRFLINTDGHIDLVGNVDALNGIDVTGNITVTGTVDGRDVASDGSKLDGIEASATADQTAAEIRTLVESASDSNVFTDADHSKLNGIESGATADQSNAEIRAAVEAASDSNVFTDADHSKLNGIESGATADQTGAEIASALGAQSIYTTGNIGRDANDHIAFTDNTQMDIYINNNNEFRFEADGDFHADGDVYAFSTTVSSDENLKKDITIVSDAVTKVEALKGVTFKWKKNDADSAGVIAQDVEKVLPEVVKTVNDMDGNEFKAVNYAGLTSILIEAVKDLSARIKVLEAK